MERITYTEIVGKQYPLNFSVRAADEVINRYGGISGINEALDIQPATEQKEETEKDQDIQALEKRTAKARKEVVWLLSLLMREGAAYCRILKGEEYKALSEDELYTVLTMVEAMQKRIDVLNAINAGLTATVEVEPETKNAETTQGV